MRKVVVLFSILLTFGLFNSCNTQGPENDTPKGEIRGVVSYSNATDASNIYLTLEQVTEEKQASKRFMPMIDEPVSREIVYTSADAEGNYSFADLPVGKYKVYAASDTSSELVVDTTVTVVADTITIPDDLTLTATGSVTGTILLDASEDNNGEFIVYLSGTSYLAVTNEKGEFEIASVPAGTEYEVKILKNQSGIDWDKVTPEPFVANSLGIKNISSADLSVVKNGTDGKDGDSIVWLGAFSSETEIVSPVKLNVYYNTEDGCSYIYDGQKWTLLASSGKQGEKGNPGDKGEAGDKGSVTLHYLNPNFLLKLVLMEGSYDEDVIIPNNYAPGQSLTLPKLSCEGKDFAGWFYDSEFFHQCEYVTYNAETDTYTLTVPADYTGTLTLYAAFGKIFTDWASYKKYINKSAEGFGCDTIFFSGTIDVTESVRARQTYIQLHYRGVNNATLSLQCNLDFLPYTSKFSMANITVEGNNKYSFYAMNSSFHNSMKIIKCAFNNLNVSANVHSNGVLVFNSLNSDCSVLIEHCSFSNNVSEVPLIGFYGSSSEAEILIKNCLFKDNSVNNPQYGYYNAVIASMAGYNNFGHLVIDNCDFNNNDYLDELAVYGVEVKGKSNIKRISLYNPGGGVTPITFNNAELTQPIEIFTNIKESDELNLSSYYFCNSDGSLMTNSDNLTFYYSVNDEGEYNIINKEKLLTLNRFNVKVTLKLPVVSNFDYVGTLNLTYFDQFWDGESNPYIFQLEGNVKTARIYFKEDVSDCYWCRKYSILGPYDDFADVYFTNAFYVSAVGINSYLKNNSMDSSVFHALVIAYDEDGKSYISKFDITANKSGILSIQRVNNYSEMYALNADEIKYPTISLKLEKDGNNISLGYSTTSIDAYPYTIYGVQEGSIITFSYSQLAQYQPYGFGYKCDEITYTVTEEQNQNFVIDLIADFPYDYQ